MIVLRRKTFQFSHLLSHCENGTTLLHVGVKTEVPEHIMLSIEIVLQLKLNISLLFLSLLACLIPHGYKANLYYFQDVCEAHDKNFHMKELMLDDGVMCELFEHYSYHIKISNVMKLIGMLSADTGR